MIKCEVIITTKIILRDTTQILTDTVKKSNRLVKYPVINGGGRFTYGGTKK
jgi:hypothetical protein